MTSRHREHWRRRPRTGSKRRNPIRLLLVDDKLIVREGVCALLDQDPGFHVIAQAASVAEAAMLDVRPDVVVTDLVLPDARGTEVVAGLEERFPRAAIFVLIDRAPRHTPRRDHHGRRRASRDSR